MTISECLGRTVKILAPTGRDLRLWKEKARGRRWYCIRERGGWPKRSKVVSTGAKMVRDGECGSRVCEAISRVSAMEV